MNKTAAVARAFSLQNDRKQQQTMKPEPQNTEKDFGKDLKAFEQLPAKTKELELLKDQAEKATGQEGIALNKMIRDKSEQGSPRLSGSQL
ncbi:MAG: hypothetical protein ABMA26_02080 [Limisphaerales bacterium]